MSPYLSWGAVPVVLPFGFPWKILEIPLSFGNSEGSSSSCLYHTLDLKYVMIYSFICQLILFCCCSQCSYRPVKELNHLHYIGGVCFFPYMNILGTAWVLSLWWSESVMCVSPFARVYKEEGWFWSKQVLWSVDCANLQTVVWVTWGIAWCRGGIGVCYHDLWVWFCFLPQSIYWLCYKSKIQNLNQCNLWRGSVFHGFVR